MRHNGGVRRCGCEDGDNCTKTTVCAIESAVDDATAELMLVVEAAIAFVEAENMDPLGPYVAQRRRTLNALHDEVGKYLEKDL